jgi:hypothetical protein
MELGRGSHVILSRAASEGLIPGGQSNHDRLPLDSPESWAAVLASAAKEETKTLDEDRRALCRSIVQAYHGAPFERDLESFAKALQRLCARSPARQPFGRCARLLLDRTAGLREIDAAGSPPSSVTPGDGSLTVVVPCCEMGGMLRETIHSVWSSDRKPDELLIVDDGSYGEETLSVLEALKHEAEADRRPLRVIRQRNRGLAAARNTGLAAATGEFIVFLDGDDIIEPSYFRLAETVLRENLVGDILAIRKRRILERAPSGIAVPVHGELRLRSVHGAHCFPPADRRLRHRAAIQLRGLGAYVPNPERGTSHRDVTRLSATLSGPGTIPAADDDAHAESDNARALPG